MADKITIPTVDFANAVSAIQKFVPKATPIPPLLNIHFHLKNNALVLTASDALAMASATIPLELPFEFDEFSVLVDADKLIKFILSLDTNDVSINPDWDSHKLILKSGRRRTTLNTMSASEYIETNFSEPEKTLDVDVDMFAKAVKLVSNYHLPSNDTKLTIYRGIKLAIDNDAFMLSATDSFVGAVYAYGEIADSNEVVVIGDQLAEAIKSLEKCDHVSLGIPSSEDKKMFIYGLLGKMKVKVVIQLLANQQEFVDLLSYFRGILDKNLSSVTFDRNDMLNALKPVDAYEDVFVTIFIKNDENILHITSEDEHVGEYSADIECIDVSNMENDLVWKMNKKFLARALKNISGYAKFLTSNPVPLVFIDEYMEGDENLEDSENVIYYQGIGKIAL